MKQRMPRRVAMLVSGLYARKMGLCFASDKARDSEPTLNHLTYILTLASGQATVPLTTSGFEVWALRL